MAIISMKKNKGFVLAFSLLISSIVLALALGIFNILLKQIVLTSTAAESQIAFYAADAGAECGLYWDTNTSRTPQNDSSAYDSNGNYAYTYNGIFALPSSYPDISLGYPFPAVVVDYLDRNGETFLCGASMQDGYVTSGDQSSATTEFIFNPSTDQNKCSKVTVKKGLNVGGAGYDTVITSRGYNVACGALNTVSRRIVERAIEVKY